MSLSNPPLGPSHPAPRTLLEHPAALPMLYLLAITLAELVTAAVNPSLGLPLHALILFAVLVHGALVEDDARRALLWGIASAPMIRIVSLSLPLVGLPLVSWYAIISGPIFVATFMIARALGYSRRDLGLVIRLRTLPQDLGMLILGLALGIGEYLILQPAPLARGLSLSETWLPALVLAVATGFEEELLFRGLLQRAALGVMGATGALLYVSALFAVLHTGYLSVVDLVFVFVVGLFFAIVVHRTGSILGVTLAHAGVNVGMFLIWPFLLPRLFGG